MVNPNNSDLRLSDLDLDKSTWRAIYDSLGALHVSGLPAYVYSAGNIKVNQITSVFRAEILTANRGMGPVRIDKLEKALAAHGEKLYVYTAADANRTAATSETPATPAAVEEPAWIADAALPKGRLYYTDGRPVESVDRLCMTLLLRKATDYIHNGGVDKASLCIDVCLDLMEGP